MLFENFRVQGHCIFLYPKAKRKAARTNIGRSMLNQSKKMLCICVAFWACRSSKKEES